MRVGRILNHLFSYCQWAIKRRKNHNPQITQITQGRFLISGVIQTLDGRGDLGKNPDSLGYVTNNQDQMGLV